MPFDGLVAPPARHEARSARSWSRSTKMAKAPGGSEVPLVPSVRWRSLIMTSILTSLSIRKQCQQPTWASRVTIVHRYRPESVAIMMRIRVRQSRGLRDISRNRGDSRTPRACILRGGI